MRRKSLQDIVAPASPKKTLAGLTRAIQHAARMKQNGHLSDREIDLLTKYAISEHLKNIDGEDFDRMFQNGELGKMQQLSGFEDDEDPDEAEAARHATGVKVLVNFFASAAADGHISPEAALEAIQEHAAIPADSDDPLADLLEATQTPDKHLGGEDTSDADTDAMIEKMYGSPGGGPRIEAGPRTVGMPAEREARKRR